MLFLESEVNSILLNCSISCVQILFAVYKVFILGILTYCLAVPCLAVHFSILHGSRIIFDGFSEEMLLTFSNIPEHKLLQHVFFGWL